MAEAVSDHISFDIIDGFILESDQNVFENLTEEERVEMNSVVTLLESAQEDSLQHFEIAESTTCEPWHKIRLTCWQK